MTIDEARKVLERSRRQRAGFGNDFVAHWKYDDALQAALAEVDRLRVATQAGRDVIAVIHGDGGDYREKHGDRKAADDAIQIVSSLRAENERLRSRKLGEKPVKK